MEQSRLLTETEKRMYLMISLIYEKVMDASNSYEQGIYNWQKVRTDLFSTIGFDDELWEALSNKGDENPDLQNRLEVLRSKYEKLTATDIINSFASIQ